ncbi:MAG: phosphoribosylglycinamide formyltransferase [Bacteroidota bacterium]
MKNIAIFASGTGSNATRIMEHFRNHDNIQVALVVSNKPKAPVLETARQFAIPTLVIQRQDFYQTENILADLAQHQIDFIALAGFLWLIPPYLIRHFERKMVNIHPALLPKYGGKGMYGQHVHQAVWQAKEQESGMTIHFVNEQYDEGAILFQASCAVLPHHTPEDIARQVLQLEHQYFAKVIEAVLSGQSMPNLTLN